MSSQCFVCVFLWVYMLQFICCVDPERSSKTPASGPFKNSIISINDCSNPSKPYVKNPPVVFPLIAHNNTMSGNITFLKDIRNMKVRLRGLILQNGKWVSFFLINNVNCHGIAMHLVCVTMHIKHDRKNCLYLKGSYSFENLDVNQILHFLISKVMYGHLLWRSEIYTQAGTYSCKEFNSLSEPA